jgi:hypothetical protein
MDIAVSFCYLDDQGVFRVVVNSCENLAEIRCWSTCMNFAKCVRAAVPFCAALLLSACAARNSGGEPSGMSVNVDLREIHRCSRISPEITVEDAPGNTEHFNVRLVEFGRAEEDRFLGSGIWLNDGSGIIPEGALTKHYRGPCPPSGQSKEYAFIVSAMSKGSIQPTVVRVYRFTQE